MTDAIVVEDRPRRRNSGGDLFGWRGAMAFVAPALALIPVFLVVPAIWTLYLGFTNRRLTGVQAIHPEWVGLDNYREALDDKHFTGSLKVTLRYVVGSAIIGQAVLGFTLAWMFRNWNSWLKRVLELTVVCAWIIPSSVVAYLWRAYLAEDGTLNAIIPGNTPWLIEHPLLSIIVFNTWRGTAFSMLLFGAAINSLPPSYLETARLAGAVDLAAAHRRRAAVDQGLHPHQPAADQPVDVQRLRPVPADRQRPRPQHPGALGVHVHPGLHAGRTSSATGRPSPRSS